MVSPRVAIAWHGLPFYATRLLEHLVRRNPSISFSIIATASDDHQSYPRFDRIATVPVNYIDHAIRFEWADLRLDVPDVFVFTSWSHPAFMSLAADAKRRSGARTACMMDNIYHGALRQWIGAVWFRVFFRRNLDALWVPGARGRGYARFLGMPPQRVMQGLYGADPLCFSLRHSPESDRARKDVLFVGQLIERKGVGAILRAAELDARFRDNVFLVGDGPMADQIERAGLRRSGFLGGTELARLYGRSSLFLLPSELDHWGVVLHEAALSGCLLAATRHCGATADLIVHGRNGFVMQEATHEEILRAAAWATTLSPEDVLAGRRMSRERADRFGPDAFCRAFEDFFGGAV